MIIYWSMMLWVPFIWFFYNSNNREEEALAEHNIKNGIHKKIPLIYGLLVFGYFIFWTGMRTYYADTSAYIGIFKNMTTNFSEGFNSIDWNGKSPGFDLFTLFFKCFISDDFQWWLMSIALVSGLCVLSAVRKYSVDLFFSGFMFISMLHFTWMMNGMRQFLVVSILFACTPLIVKKKYIPYIILVAILSTIHSSAWLMLPMLFVVYGAPWKWKTGLFIAGMILFTMFAEPIFGGAVEVFGNDYYSVSLNQFSEDDGVNPIRVAFYLIPPIIAFWQKNEFEKYYEMYPILPISVNMSLATAALYLVGMFTSGILIGRLPIYCDLYNLIMIPFILRICLGEENKKTIKYVYVIVMVLFFYLQMNGDYYISELTGMVR